MSIKKRSRRGAGSVRRRVTVHKDGTEKVYYEGRFFVGYDCNGKQIQKSITRSSRSEVEIELKRLGLSILDNNYIEKNSVTVAELVTHYIDSGVRQKQSTIREYHRSLRLYIIPTIGNIKVQNLTCDDVTRWIQSLQYHDNGQRWLADKTITGVFSIFKASLSYAITEKIINRNPCDSIKLRKPTRKKPPTILNEKDIVNIYNHISQTPHENLYKLSMFLGLRIMELLGIVIDDIDFERNLIHLSFQRRKDLTEKLEAGETLHFKLLKDYEKRDIFFGDEIKAILLNQVAIEREKKSRIGSDWPIKQLERGDLLFSNKFGSYLSYKTCYDCFKRIVKKIGLEKVTLHDLRHVYTCLAISNGDDVKTVSEHLGHSTPDFTFSVYAYTNCENKIKSAHRMDKVISAYSNGQLTSAIEDNELIPAHSSGALPSTIEDDIVLND